MSMAKRVFVRSRRDGDCSNHDPTASDQSSDDFNKKCRQVNPERQTMIKEQLGSQPNRTSHHRNTSKRTPDTLSLTFNSAQRPNNVSLTATVHKKHEDSSSTDSEGDETFFRPPQSTVPIQLFPLSHYVTPLFDISTQYRHHQLAPLDGTINITPLHNSFNIQPVLGKIPSQSPSETQSSLSSPLPPLSTRALRKGGTSPGSNSDYIGMLENILPDHILQVYVGTWNMHEEKDISICLDDFLLPLSQERVSDLIIIGTQESTPNKSEWELTLQQTLGPSHVLIHSSSLGCLYLCVFLRRDLIWYCSDILSCSFATRPVSTIKTKGSVGIRLTLFGSTFVFITSHFTAGFYNTIERNSDMQKIMINMTFTGLKSNKLIQNHDFIFWCGDFNYRVELERNVVDEAIRNKNWISLLLHDQLTREILAGNVFEGFSEQPINFPPTYKFDLNQDVYDSSELVRVPSWTDRILFRASSQNKVVGCGYDSTPSIKISDHRPVYGVFQATLRPCKEVDGVPTNPASYDRDLYIKALKRRKNTASTSTTRQVEKTRVEPLSQRQQSRTNTTSSVLCILL